MLRACIRCGRPSRNGRCPAHTPHAVNPSNGRSVGRDRSKQARFRREVLTRDGHACTICGATEDLRACHIIPFSENPSYDVANGRTLCRTHDRMTDRYAT